MLSSPVKSKSTVNNYLIEGLYLLQLGIEKQANGVSKDYSEMFQQAIEKVSKALTTEEDKKINKKKKKDVILECYSMFERIKNRKVMIPLSSKGMNEIILCNEVSQITDIFHRNIKLLEIIGQGIESGFHLTKALHIRKEIWTQSSAKINFLSQKYDAITTIANIIDDRMTLIRSGVYNLSNFDRFVDVLVDIQNSFSKEMPIIKPVSYQLSREVSSNSFHKKFTDISAKIKSNLLSSSKLGDKPDYFELVKKLFKNAKDIELICSSVEKDKNMNETNFKAIINSKKVIVSNFLFGFIYRIVSSDLHDLTLRFLKKRILGFEEK